MYPWQHNGEGVAGREEADTFIDGPFGEGRNVCRADHRHRLLLSPRHPPPKVLMQMELRGEAEQMLL